jgi:hypothetical protein
MPVSEPGSTTPRWRTGKPLMTRRGRVVVLGASCLVSATLALVQFRPAPPRVISDVPPELTAVEVEQPAPSAPASRPAARKSAAVSKTTAVNRPVKTASAAPVPVKSDITTSVSARAPREAQASIAPSMVTISGCLEQADERFRLKDTAGDEAPRGRTWKSGFLRRSASTIDVVDHADRLHLPTYVGQRVSVTGTLVDREMQVRSVSIVSESCQEKSA